MPAFGRPHAMGCRSRASLITALLPVRLDYRSRSGGGRFLFAAFAASAGRPAAGARQDHSPAITFNRGSSGRSAAAAFQYLRASSRSAICSSQAANATRSENGALAAGRSAST